MATPTPIPSSSPILVVDDEQDIVLTLRDLLEAEGHQINVASTGGTALESVKQHSPSVVILDVKLPDMDGLLVLEKMTKAVPGLPVSYTHLRAHETDSYLVCRLLLEKK